MELQFDAERSLLLSRSLSLLAFNQFGAAKHGVLIRWYVGFSLLFRFTILYSALLGTIFSRKKREATDSRAAGAQTKREKKNKAHKLNKAQQSKKSTNTRQVQEHPQSHSNSQGFVTVRHRRPSVRPSVHRRHFLIIITSIVALMMMRNSACINESYCCEIM